MRAVARPYGWEREVHHFLDATASQRVAFNNYAIEPLRQRTLAAQFGGRLLAGLI